MYRVIPFFISITARRKLLSLALLRLLLVLLAAAIAVLGLFLDETPDAQVVDDLLELIGVVLERVKLLPEAVVLEVEEPEPGEEVSNESGDPDGTLVVSLGNAVHGESSQLVAQTDEAVQVILQVQVRLPIFGVRLGFDAQPLLGSRTLEE